MDMIIHILHNLSDEYKNMFKFIKNNSEAESAMLGEVKVRPRTKFEWLNKSKEQNKNALVSMNKFKSVCSLCGIYGHKVSECKKSKKKNDHCNEKQAQQD
jgi:hypothetical protein